MAYKKSMEPIRFVHAADLHLDSPLPAIADTDSGIRETLQGATLSAVKRVVNHTIHAKADFLVIAGDVYDSKDRSLRALVAFRKQMERLAERNIPVFIVHGNHDPLNGWGSGFQLPPNVITFGGRTDTESFIRGGRELAQVTGISYTKERVTDNLASSFKRAGETPYSIAVLHANIGHQAGHADYAPATVEDLAGSGFNYWALGHVHTRAVLSSQPAMLVYPGNTQGRNPREQGPRGCYQVDVDSHGRAHLQFIETNVAQWAHVDVSIRSLTRMEDLIQAILQKGRDAAAIFDGPTIVRCTLTGNGPLHVDLQREGMAEELCEVVRETIVPESVRIATGPELDLESLARTETMVSDFLKLTQRALEDAEFRAKLGDQLGSLFRRREMKPFDDVRLREWIERASTMGIDLLLES